MPNSNSNKTDLIRSLGILGWTELEPTILAALATQSPLLLIGPHGTAKSMLLEKLAQTLKLEFRHYNASTLNFDDLVGFPVPDGDQVKYLRTPLDAWNAEAIFVDEISRCRIDMQNRLFPLVHECKLQGQKLTKLKFRWAAMNPPPTGEEDENQQYIGAEPLDPAFADRFHWIIYVPTNLKGSDLLSLIRGPKTDPDASSHFCKEVQEIRGRLKTTEELYGEKIATYIQYAYPMLRKHKIDVSNRRVRILYQNILALIATQRYDSLVEPAMIALQNSLPQRCWELISEVKIIKICRSAEECLREKISPLQKSILLEHCPLKRAKIATEHNAKKLIIPIILDGLESLPYGKRLIFSYSLFHILARYRHQFPSLVFELLAKDVSIIENSEFDIQKNTWEYVSDQEEQLLYNIQELPDDKKWLRRIFYLCFQKNQNIEELIDYAEYASHLAQELEENLKK